MARRFGHLWPNSRRRHHHERNGSAGGPGIWPTRGADGQCWRHDGAAWLRTAYRAGDVLRERHDPVCAVHAAWHRNAHVWNRGFHRGHSRRRVADYYGGIQRRRDLVSNQPGDYGDWFTCFDKRGGIIDDRYRPNGPDRPGGPGGAGGRYSHGFGAVRGYVEQYGGR